RYGFQWYRCGQRGTHCTRIPHGRQRALFVAHGTEHTFRVVVTARNAHGSSVAVSGWSGFAVHRTPAPKPRAPIATATPTTTTTTSAPTTTTTTTTAPTTTTTATTTT